MLVSARVILVADTEEFGPTGFAANIAFFNVALLFGWTVQSRRIRLAEAEERAEILQREQEEERARAVADERLHIAQELHDVVAHSMSVIAVQAGVGLHVADTDAAEAKKALENISMTSRRRSRSCAGSWVCCVTTAPAPASTRARTGRSRRARREVSDAACPSRCRSKAIPRCTARCRSHRLPHRAGGADERAEARRPGPAHVTRRLPSRRAAHRGGRRRARCRTVGRPAPATA